MFYEKYGEDTMKRSINNQLISQLIVIHVTFYNLFCGFVFSWRFIFGPVYFFIAAFESYISNIWIVWELIILAELAIFRALFALKFSCIMGIDEIFAGRFILRFNIGCVFISQTGRYVNGRTQLLLPLTLKVAFRSFEP